MKQARHGDLLLVRIEEIPASAKRAEDKILAYGEATGHKHQLLGSAVIFRDQERQFVEIVAPSKLVHEEHREIQLPEGFYAVTRQREYDAYEQAVRMVQD